MSPLRLMLLTAPVLGALALPALTLPALAETAAAPDPHAGHAMPAAGGDTSPSTLAYQAANETMHKDMASAFTGDADVDFVMGMIPHHQGAIDMAKVVLEHGQDPEIRRLAEGVITAQEGEIAMMKAWLAAHGHPVE